MASKPQKMSSDPFCCLKVQCKCIFVPCHLLHVSLPHFTAVLRMCTIALFNHKPHLIVTHVNNWSAPLFNGSRPSFFCSVNGTWELRVAHPQPNVPLVPIIWMLPWLWHVSCKSIIQVIRKSQTFLPLQMHPSKSNLDICYETRYKLLRATEKPELGLLGPGETTDEPTVIKTLRNNSMLSLY